MGNFGIAQQLNGITGDIGLFTAHRLLNNTLTTFENRNRLKQVDYVFVAISEYFNLRIFYDLISANFFYIRKIPQKINNRKTSRWNGIFPNYQALIFCKF